MNKYIGEKTTIIKKKLVKIRLRWFDHVHKRPLEVLIQRVDQLDKSPTFRSRRKQKKTISKTI